MCAPSVCRFIAWNVFQWMIIVKCLVCMYCGNGNLTATSKINPHLYMAQKWQHICICFSFTFIFQLSFDLIRCLQNKNIKRRYVTSKVSECICAMLDSNNHDICVDAFCENVRQSKIPSEKAGKFDDFTAQKPKWRCRSLCNYHYGFRSFHDAFNFQMLF